MLKEIPLETMLTTKSHLRVDVRSPIEFEEDCIPEAVNVPLLFNDERTEVGKIYCTKGPLEAKKLGLEICAARFPDLVNQIIDLAKDRSVVVYCWRGGLRSKVVGILLDLMGIPVYQLKGGYKSYRKYVVKFFEHWQLPFKFVVLHGLTGVGKTDVIKELQKLGQAAIDLEGLANHRGSVFGHIGMKKQPTQKHFENLLLNAIQNFKPDQEIIVECESKRIGQRFIPDSFYRAMCAGDSILLYAPLQHRIDRIIKEYILKAGVRPEILVQPIRSLQKRLGKQKTEKLICYLQEHKLHQVVKLLLQEYYDPLYKFPDGPVENYDYCTKVIDPHLAAKEIISCLETRAQKKTNI